MSKLEIIFTIAGLHPESGGPSRSVPQLCEALARASVHVEIVSLHYGGRFGSPLVPPPELVRTTFVPCTTSSQRRLRWTGSFTNILRERCRATGAQILHDNGLWLLNNHAAAGVAAELGIQRIVSPRGMLTSWAMEHKKWKKRVAWWLYQHRDLDRANAVVAASRREAGGVQQLFPRMPLAVVANGVEFPAVSGTPVTPNGGDHKLVVYLGRIHPVKGLRNLVEAWHSLRPKGWRCVLAGPDEAGHQRELESALSERGLRDTFKFLGMVHGETKWQLLRQAELLVLPSYSENFGIAVVEALAAGVPAIATQGTPWEELRTHCCGWWVPVGVEPLEQALREAIAMSPDQRREFGLRGRQLVQERYTWPAIARRMMSVYDWVLGGPRPECVIAP